MNDPTERVGVLFLNKYCDDALNESVNETSLYMFGVSSMNECCNDVLNESVNESEPVYIVGDLSLKE